jgi:hypothetical protein
MGYMREKVGNLFDRFHLNEESGRTLAKGGTGFIFGTSSPFAMTPQSGRLFRNSCQANNPPSVPSFLALHPRLP